MIICNFFIFFYFFFIFFPHNHIFFCNFASDKIPIFHIMNNTFHLRFKTNKTYLFCLFAIFVPSMVFSQNQWFEVSCGATPKKVIVREYNYPEVITYTEEAGSHLFTHNDLSTMDFCSEIIPEIFVNDFIVNGDTVYFCGFYKSNINEGCVGWFDYNDFFYGNKEYHFYHRFSEQQRHAVANFWQYNYFVYQYCSSEEQE